MLCEREAERADGTAGERFELYAEKRLHRILKDFISEDKATQEQSVGKYTADAIVGEEIFEIQTKSLRPLLPKLSYYLENTEYRVTVVHPIVAEKTLIRAERETGEVLSCKRSPKKGRVFDVYVYYIGWQTYGGIGTREAYTLYRFNMQTQTEEVMQFWSSELIYNAEEYEYIYSTDDWSIRLRHSLKMWLDYNEDYGNNFIVRDY